MYPQRSPEVRTSIHFIYCLSCSFSHPIPLPLSLSLSLASFPLLCSLAGSVISPLSDGHFVSVYLISCLQFPSLSLLCYQLFILGLKHRTHADLTVPAMLQTSALQDNTHPSTPNPTPPLPSLSHLSPMSNAHMHTSHVQKQIHSNTPTCPCVHTPPHVQSSAKIIQTCKNIFRKRKKKNITVTLKMA